MGTSLTRKTYGSDTAPAVSPTDPIEDVQVRVASNSPDSDAATTVQDRVPLRLGRRTIVISLALVLTGLLGVVASAGFAPTASPVTEAEQAEIFALRERIQTTETDAETMPVTAAAQRALVRAQSASAEVATLQNDYRLLSASVLTNGGKLDSAMTVNVRRALTPYFGNEIDEPLLNPWYLLAADADVPAGTGVPALFDSGFAWTAQTPSTVNLDGSVPVRWLAVETRPSAGQPAVLAWAQADYDITRQVFVDVSVGVTAVGDDLCMEVQR